VRFSSFSEDFSTGFLLSSSGFDALPPNEPMASCPWHCIVVDEASVLLQPQKPGENCFQVLLTGRKHLDCQAHQMLIVVRPHGRTQNYSREQ